MDEKFLSEVDQALTGWSDPVARLKDALAKDEFALYCQPIRSLTRTPEFPMGEVLVRLREEEAAQLPPGDFIPVFEHYKMMPQLDRWVVRKVLQRLKQGSRIPRLTINVSAQSLEDPQFPPFVGAELKISGVPAASLLFEVDENDLLDRQKACARFARDVRRHGCGVMIDGFGRRTVSFSTLESVPVDFIKVDGSIVRKLLAGGSAESKMKAVLRVADAAGFGVVAECVEEDAVLAKLKALGVAYAQGFGVHRPEPINAVAG